MDAPLDVPYTLMAHNNAPCAGVWKWVLMSLSALWVSKEVWLAFTDYFSNSAPREPAKFVPRQDLEEVVAQPEPGTPLSVPPGLSSGPSCIFSYTTGPLPLTANTTQMTDVDPDMIELKESCLIWRARLYGARPPAKGTLSTATGNPKDVLSGWLFCWPHGVSSDRLRVWEKHILHIAPSDKALIRRGVVRAVLVDGRTEEALWYFRKDKEAIAKYLANSRHNPVSGMQTWKDEPWQEPIDSGNVNSTVNNKEMRAIYLTARPAVGNFSAALKFGRVPKPTLPLRAGEVLVEIGAATVNLDDIYLQQGSFIGGVPFAQARTPTVKHPAVPGADFAGIVRGLGKGVTGVSVGDRVVGLQKTPFLHQPGTWAEYTVAPQENVFLLPPNLTLAQGAALVVPAMMACAMVDRAKLPLKPQPQKLLVVGASGGIGAVLVQFLKAQAHVNSRVHITGVCSGANAELVKQLGADRVVDYTTGPIEQQLAAEKGSFDAVFDLVGGEATYAAGAYLLKKSSRTGGFVTVVGPEKYAGSRMMTFGEQASMLGGILRRSLFSSLPGLGPRYVFSASFGLSQKDLDRAVALGLRPVVDREVPLALGPVQEAVDLVASHRARGKVVIKSELVDARDSYEVFAVPGI